MIIPTGIPGLDALLGGGFKSSSNILVAGPPGSGKSILSRQILYDGLNKGFSSVYITVDEPPQQIRENMISFKWDISKFEQQNSFRFIDAFTCLLGEF
ncbi:MAG: DUF2075 domain-containing protein, partial [Euryarchaeota archaeon]|nr:DUF2075 domain-containing protein [Euryarchaeota archaeon]